MLDHALLHRARRSVDGANAHFLKTLIFCYETAETRSPQKRRYELALRQYIVSTDLMLKQNQRPKYSSHRSGWL
jgi:hypothetical protein